MTLRAACLVLMIAVGTAAPSTAVPVEEIAFTGFVVDQAAVLTPEEKRRLTMKLEAFQQRTGHQFAVVTVATLDGEDIAPFTTRQPLESRPVRAE
jgi:uncharacterized protein